MLALDNMNSFIFDKNKKMISIGDEVQLNIMQDDSGMASDLFGAEPQNDYWHEGRFIDRITVKVIFYKGAYCFTFRDRGYDKKKDRIISFKEYLESYPLEITNNVLYGVTDPRDILERFLDPELFGKNSIAIFHKRRVWFYRFWFEMKLKKIIHDFEVTNNASQ